MKNAITLSAMDITSVKLYSSKYNVFSTLIKQVALKVNERIFFYKKSLTGYAQLGNIRIR